MHTSTLSLLLYLCALVLGSVFDNFWKLSTEKLTDLFKRRNHWTVISELCYLNTGWWSGPFSRILRKLLIRVCYTFVPCLLVQFGVIFCLMLFTFAFSALMLLVGHPACRVMGAGVVVYLERGADLHIIQLMSLPLTVSCFSKIQIGFTFLAPAYPGSPAQRAIKRCVCVCVLFTYVC